MRLICPNCGAQYEVPDEVIPETGRDVQCSNCGDTWFQNHPDHPAPEQEPEPTPEPEPEQSGHQDVTWDSPQDEAGDTPSEPVTAPEPEPEQADASQGDDEDADDHDGENDTPEPPRRQLDPAIADVLREEAEHEREARAAETGGLETQPDLGLTQDQDDEDRRTRESRARMARLRGEPEDQSPASVPEAEDIDPSSRRNLLPDIDEINSSLDASTVGSHHESMASDDIDDLQPAPPRKSGFKRGFSYAVLLALILLAVYNFAPQIAEMVPSLAGPLETYVEQVNGLRVMLDEQFGWLGDWVRDMSSPATTGE
ncbi:zinc-ribbon domain-containing protein [uncultured Roseovarius sp.]|uniref:zinc-ribbon domain-containing protein n=1 Tax=uncultured Roseovarius sp. TaxID=293344 RepID=UPI0025DB22E2|nr:zinc-ribbon domain-containing protein [uncultured Roseovarius sp.]